MGEKIGEIRVEEHPYVSKGFKYQVYVMLDKPFPEEILSEDPDYADESFEYYLGKGFDIIKAKRITEDQLPREDRALLAAFRKVDPEKYQTEYEGQPAYVLFVVFDEEIETYKTPYRRVPKHEIAYDQFTEWLDKEGYRVLTGSARKVARFPWERVKVKARIQITKEMFEKAMEKVEQN